MNSSAANGQAEQSGYARDLDILRQTPFFSGLPLEALKVLAYLATLESYKPGDYLFRQEEMDDRAFYLVTGSVELLRNGQEGEHALDKVYATGDFLGGLSLLAETPRLYSLRATAETECIVLTREKFTKTMEQFPDMVPRVLEAVVKGVREWEYQFVMSHAEVCEICRSGLGVSLV
jgi:CRP-like cAMP-binding protein